MSIRVETFDKGDVVVIEVQPSLLPPVRYKGKTWIRTGPRKGFANETEERVLTEKRVSFARNFDAEPCLEATLSDLSLDIIKLLYLPLAIDRDILEANHREIKMQLASLRLYDFKNDVPTNASILLFGLNPLFFFNGAYIQYIKTNSIDRDLSKVEEEKQFKGSLFDVLKEIDNFIKNNIVKSKPVRIENSFQDKIVSNYPNQALREFVMNAIMHRDYRTNRPIYIYEFLDRIEIHNSGGLYGNVRPENFPKMNDYRNPTVAEAMRLMRYVNRFNYGISDAQKHLATNGNPEAVFDFTISNNFLVTVKINPEW
jgi:ATP-dependent DNA helicase RecG